MNIQQLIKDKKRIITASVLLLLFAIITPASPLVTTAHAADNDDARTYLQVYSEKGVYTKVKIQAVGINDDSHSCGGALNAGNGYTIVKRLSKVRATTIRCSAVGGAGSYTVSFIKSKSSANQAVLAQAGVDTTVSKCTIIGPHVAQYKAATTNRCPSSAPETPTKHTMRLQMCLVASNGTCTQPSGNTVSVRNGPNAYVRLFDTGSVDGDPNASRQFCTGSLSYTYRNTATGAIQGPYTAKLRFSTRGGGMDDRCTVRIGNDAAKFTSSTSYTVTADYAGNEYVNPVNSTSPNSDTLSFTTK